MSARTRIALAAVVAALSLTVAVAPASAGKTGPNNANAKLCQKGGWQTLVQADGTSFTSEQACTSYAAQGGTLTPKPACTAGSDNFSDDANGSRPTTFAGGTIEGPYRLFGFEDGGVVVVGNAGNGFPVGTHVLENGASPVADIIPFRLTFTTAVSSVQLDASGTAQNAQELLTLKAYDSSDAIVDTDTFTSPGGTVGAMSVTSATNNIKYFTMEADSGIGLIFTNIVWGCV